MDPLTDVLVETFPGPERERINLFYTNVYKEINICLDILEQSKKNLPSYKTFVEKNWQINKLMTCQNLAALLCLVGIPSTFLAGAIACHSYLAVRIHSKITPLLLALTQAQQARNFFMHNYDRALALFNSQKHSDVNIHLSCLMEWRHSGTDRNICKNRMHEANARVDESIRNYTAEYASEKLSHEHILQSLQQEIIDLKAENLWNVPLDLLFLIAFAASSIYMMYLLLGRRIAREDYETGIHSLDQCVEAEQIPRIVELTAFLNLSATSSVEERIKNLKQCKSEEGFKESLFLLCIYLRENHLPEELIRLIAEVSMLVAPVGLSIEENPA